MCGGRANAAFGQTSQAGLCHARCSTFRLAMVLQDSQICCLTYKIPGTRSFASRLGIAKLSLQTCLSTSGFFQHPKPTKTQHAVVGLGRSTGSPNAKLALRTPVVSWWAQRQSTSLLTRMLTELPSGAASADGSGAASVGGSPVEAATSSRN